MIFGFLIDKGFRVMFAQSFQRVIASKSISVINRTFVCFLTNITHQSLRTNVINNFCINSLIALKQAKNNTFTSRPYSSFAFAFTTKIRFVHLYFSRKFSSFQFASIINHMTNFLVKTANGFIMATKVCSKAISRLLTIESLQNSNFMSKLFKAFLSKTFGTFNITSRSSRRSKRTTKNTLFTVQKIDMATKYILPVSNHNTPVRSFGYDFIQLPIFIYLNSHCEENQERLHNTLHQPIEPEDESRNSQNTQKLIIRSIFPDKLIYPIFSGNVNLLSSRESKLCQPPIRKR